MKEIGEFPSLVCVLHKAVLDAKRNGSGLDARTIAGVVDKPYHTLMSELSRQDGHKLGADLLLPLMTAVGTDEVIRFICRESGGVFVPLRIPSDNPESLVAVLSKSIKNFGEFTAEAARNLPAADISRERLERINRVGEDAVEAILGMLKLVGALHQRQYGS